MLRLRGQLQAEEILELQAGDDHRDAGGEAGGHRIGDELDQLAHPRQPHTHQHDPGHETGGHQSAEAIFFGDGMQDHDEGGGWAGHAEAGAAGQSDQHSGDNGGIKTVLRRHPTADGQRHRQRHRDDADGDARQQVGLQLGEVIAAAQLVAQGSAEGQIKRVFSVGFHGDFWNCNKASKPSSSCMGFGGQPGICKSTGITSETPPTQA